MNLTEVNGLYPKSGDYFNNFLRPISPRLDTSSLSLNIVIAAEYPTITGILLTGDSALVLSYKNYPGYALSFNQTTTDLVVLQLQGAHSKKGYRVCTGVKIPDLYASEVNQLAQLSESKRIVLPYDIEGDNKAMSSLAIPRYGAFANRTGMVYSAQERAYIRDLP